MFWNSKATESLLLPTPAEPSEEGQLRAWGGVGDQVLGPNRRALSCQLVKSRPINIPVASFLIQGPARGNWI